MEISLENVISSESQSAQGNAFSKKSEEIKTLRKTLEENILQSKDSRKVDFSGKEMPPAEVNKLIENELSPKNSDQKTENTLSPPEEIEKEKPIISNSTLRYKIVENEDKETGNTTKQLVVFLVDKETGEVIRQIPPPPPDFYEKNNFFSKGNFLDQIV